MADIAIVSAQLLVRSSLFGESPNERIPLVVGEIVDPDLAGWRNRFREALRLIDRRDLDTSRFSVVSGGIGRGTHGTTGCR